MEPRAASPDPRPAVVFLPGGVTPAAISYAPLLGVIGERVRPELKDLELYANESPPVDYDLEMEIDGLRRAADAAGFRTFHLVAYSGGAAIALAFVARHPERLESLALIEPAWIGNEGWSAEDAADWAALDAVMALPREERMRGFMLWHMRPGADPPAPPPGPAPDWMARRPAGLEALAAAFRRHRLDRERFREFRRPAYYAVGDRSRAFFERNGRTLAGFFPDLRVERYAGRSHFDPPHRVEPERFARALEELRGRAGRPSRGVDAAATEPDAV